MEGLHPLDAFFHDGKLFKLLSACMAGHKGDQTSNQKNRQGVEFQIRSESSRIYESIPDVIWHPPVPHHITGIDLNPDIIDADRIMTTPNRVYGMQISVDVEQNGSELSYCEAYHDQRQQEDELSDHHHEYREFEGQGVSYCNAYFENKSFAKTI